MEGVRAENGPPGVGLKSAPADVMCFAFTVIPSPAGPDRGGSSSSSDNVSAKHDNVMGYCHVI